MRLQTKYKKPTDKELGHTDVYDGEKLLGYYMSNNSIASGIDENWNFCNTSNHPKLTYFHTKTRNEMHEQLDLKYFK